MGILVTCPTCKKRKAASASKCPHCGEQYLGRPGSPSGDVQWGCLGMIIIGIIVLVIFIFAARNGGLR